MKKKIMPPTYFIVCLVLSLSLHFIHPLKRIINSPYTYSGILLIVFGAVLNIWADNMFKKSKTTVKPHENPTELETSGPFRISRHPMYLGMASILLGSAIITGSLTSFLPIIIFIVIIETIFIPLEEKNMRKAFGEKYSDYQKRVRRWV